MSESAVDMIARITGVSREERVSQMRGEINPKAQRVTKCPELERILSLPRRDWINGAPELAARMTEALRTPSGAMHLFPIQAAALRELFLLRGLVAPISVGGGKTAVTFLAPVVLSSVRPLVLVPAGLQEKTEHDFAELREHFKGPLYIRVESYEKLGREKYRTMLEDWRPDLIVCDEAHRLANPKAAVSRRVRRYLNAWEPQAPGRPVLAVLSGTILNRELRELADLQRMALEPSGMDFLPRDWETLSVWSASLNSKLTKQRRPSPGALIEFCDDEGRREFVTRPVAAARKGLRDRITSTPGVIATQGGKDLVEASLQVSMIRSVSTPEMEEAFQRLRKRWETPDGHPCADGIAIWRAARQLALGCYYVWDPRPPEWWTIPRATWAYHCREILKSNRRQLDSEVSVINAINAGHYHESLEALRHWQDAKPHFEMNVRAVWITDAVLEQIAHWMNTPVSRGGGKNAGIVWVEHAHVAQRLAQMTGAELYGPQATNANGDLIMHHDPRKRGAVIASVDACSTGQNLQAFSANLITSAKPTGKLHEQMLGRTHRHGQKADTVTAAYLVGCREDLKGLAQARADALNIQQLTGADQKLVYADFVHWYTPADADRIEGAAWLPPWSE